MIAEIVLVIVLGLVAANYDTEKEGGETSLCVGICMETSSDKITQGEDSPKSISVEIKK